jgi:hypothetical protein
MHNANMAFCKIGDAQVSADPIELIRSNTRVHHRGIDLLVRDGFYAIRTEPLIQLAGAPNRWLA